ncbi:MAG TPA: hypothetical protein VK479_15720 [Micropepsaceae bacterium]|nr:hypothetical protein [Micropepsaceae bacterium]
MTTVYVLWHTYQKTSGDDEEKLIGIYSTEGNARTIIERIKSKPGFRDHPTGFQVVPVTLDQSEWLEGFGI